MTREINMEKIRNIQKFVQRAVGSKIVGEKGKRCVFKKECTGDPYRVIKVHKCLKNDRMFPGREMGVSS